LAILAVLVVALVVGTTIWVGFDCRALIAQYGDEDTSESAFGWVVGCLFLWIIVFPLYLFHRRSYRLVYEEEVADSCPGCGAERRDGAIYCPACGSPSTADNSVACGSCGGPLEPSDEFCPACGVEATHEYS
jgi:RNA polymerase subunit RPABC4/transcription elongation factor Spt4